MKRSRSSPLPTDKPTEGERRNDSEKCGICTSIETDTNNFTTTNPKSMVKRVRFDDKNNRYNEALNETTTNSSEEESVSNSWYTNAEYQLIRSNVAETLILYRQQQQQLEQHQQQVGPKQIGGGSTSSAGVDAASEHDLPSTMVNIQVLTPPRNPRLPQPLVTDEEHPQHDPSINSNTMIDPDDENLCIRGIEQYVSSDIAQGKYQRRSVHRRLTILKHRLQRKQQQQQLEPNLIQRLVDQQAIHLDANANGENGNNESIQPPAIVKPEQYPRLADDVHHSQYSMYQNPIKADEKSTDTTLMCPTTKVSKSQTVNEATSTSADTSSPLEVSSAELIFSTLEIEKAYIMGLHDANEAYKVHIAESIASALPSSINPNKA
jgi:hypothetical protein